MLIEQTSLQGYGVARVLQAQMSILRCISRISRQSKALGRLSWSLYRHHSVLQNPEDFLHDGIEVCPKYSVHVFKRWILAFEFDLTLLVIELNPETTDGTGSTLVPR